MNLIFLTLSSISDINTRGIYSDLLRKFRDEGHNIYVVSPRERRMGESTFLRVEDGVTILGVKTLNIQKTNVIEKGLGTVMIEWQFKRAIEKYLKGKSFDLILYSTPPITFPNVIKHLKRKNPKAVSYLLLKDIFPQNAVDLGMFGEKSLFYKFFRRKEKALYKLSDYIGCMSPANVDFVLKHNPDIEPQRVEVAPNSIALSPERGVDIDKDAIRKKYNLPVDKPVFVYGGNLGKPQGIDFLIKCLKAIANREDCHFVVVGSGTEYTKLESFASETKPKNINIMSALLKEEYDNFVRACDIGLIFLDHRFTIPNYPSRLLSYLEYKMPIIAATDPNTDIGKIAVDNGYGLWCESNDVSAFVACVDRMLASPIKEMGEKGYRFLESNYLVDNTYNKIVSHI